jgi:hypothetical protein
MNARALSPRRAHPATFNQFTIRPNSASQTAPATSIAYGSQNRRVGRNRTVIMNRCG